MPRVSRCPAAGGSLREKLFTVRAALAPNDPRTYIIRVVTGVTLVVKRKLFDRVAARVETVTFVVESPLSVTASTRDGRYLGFVGRKRIVRHGFASS